MTITKIFQTCAALALCSGAFASNGRVALARLGLTFESSSGGYLSHGEGFQAHFSQTGVTLAFDADRAVSMRFPGANTRPLLAVEDPQSHKSNYLTGADPRRWRTNVAQYGKLRYANLYPGVDLVFYGHRNLLEYDFVVRPGADPRCVAIEFHGARSVEVDPHGALTVATAEGELIHHKPVIYQESYGRRTTVEGRYALAAHNRVTFEIGAYDRTAPLIIDPVVQYSSYLGGTSPANSADDIAYAVALDSEENIYVSGRTTARDFPLKRRPSIRKQRLRRCLRHQARPDRAEDPLLHIHRRRQPRTRLCHRGRFIRPGSRRWTDRFNRFPGEECGTVPEDRPQQCVRSQTERRGRRPRMVDLSRRRPQRSGQRNRA